MAAQRNGTPRSADTVLGAPSLELVQGVLDRTPGPHAFAVAYCFSKGEYQRGAELRADPRDFDDPDGFALALQSVSLFRKYPGLPGSEGKAEKAIEKWLVCEKTCATTNERIRDFRIGQVRPDLHEPFRLARKKILGLLGEFRWKKVAPFFDFGPGSTTRLPFSMRHPTYKYGEDPETTFDNLASAVAVISLSPMWSESTGGYKTSTPLPSVKIREESKVTTVPKDAFIDRVIAIEPDLNMFVQKGFGGFIRRRLKRVGVDLNDQTLNQLLAQQGSRGGLATLDLASASDTVSYELVKELLPPDWFEALLSCRTHASRLPSGEIIDLQKFSAMGNGFTFELESLIFWALCSSVATHYLGREGLRVSVYGDDIITTVEDFDKCVDILQFAGFTVNEKKTYASGPYRESCGKHYFYGRDVTPVTVTKEISKTSQLLLLCNNLQRWALRLGGGLYRHVYAKDAFTYARGFLPLHFQRARIPDGFGDGALIGPFDECRPQRCCLGWDGWRVKGVLLTKQQYRLSSGVATLVAVLAGSERRQHAPPPDIRVLKALRGQLHKVRASNSQSGYWEMQRQLSYERDKYLAASGSDVPCAPVGLKSGRAFVPFRELTRKGCIFVNQWSDIGPWG